MKKLIILLFISFSLQTFSQNDFRKMNWGDTPAQLKSIFPDEKWEVETLKDMKFYLTEDYIGGITADIAYCFVEGKLQMGAYRFKEQHSSDNLYHEDYLSISKILNKKYEMERSETWNDTTWKGNDNYIGYALSKGDVQIEERYEGEKTIVIHTISGDGYKIEHVLGYTNKTYLKAMKESTLDDF